MKTEIILLIKYLITIYLLSFVFFTVVQKIHKTIYTPATKKKHQKNINRCNNKKFKNKNLSKNRRLTNTERKRIQKKYNLLS